MYKGILSGDQFELTHMINFYTPYPAAVQDLDS